MKDLISESMNEAKHSHKQCMNCKCPPTLEVLWAEGMGHAWFCQKCFDKWESKDDVVSMKPITDGEACKKYADNKNPTIKESTNLLTTMYSWLKESNTFVAKKALSHPLWEQAQNSIKLASQSGDEDIKAEAEQAQAKGTNLPDAEIEKWAKEEDDHKPYEQEEPTQELPSKEDFKNKPLNVEQPEDSITRDREVVQQLVKAYTDVDINDPTSIEKGGHSPVKVIDRLVQDEEFNQLDTFDKIKVMAQVERKDFEKVERKGKHREGSFESGIVILQSRESDPTKSTRLK